MAHPVWSPRHPPDLDTAREVPFYACQTAHSDSKYSTTATAMKAIANNLTSCGKLTLRGLRNTDALL
jgi:hypothetical protein